MLVLLAVLAGARASAGGPAAPLPLPLPKNARLLADGRYASPLGFRDTVEWYEKELARRGVHVKIDGPLRTRDVVVVRVLPLDTNAGWSAVHIVLAERRTTIYIVAAFRPGQSLVSPENQRNRSGIV